MPEPNGPSLIVTVDLEIPDYVAGQRDFVAQANKVGAQLEVNTVAGAGHGFDAMFHEPHAIEAVDAGLTWMTSALRRPATLS